MRKIKATTIRTRRIVTDDALMDFSTTCSNRGVALAAEMELRRRHPSRKASRRIKEAQARTQGVQ